MSVILNAIPVASVDEVFEGQIVKLKDQSRRIYTAGLLGYTTIGDTCSNSVNHQRKWQLPDNYLNIWDGDLFNISGNTSMKYAFDRECPNALYVRALLRNNEPLGRCSTRAPVGEGRIADCQSEKVQVDYLSCMERAFRLRHSTIIRSSIHSLIRRRGQSTWGDTPPGTDGNGPSGGTFTFALRYVIKLIRDGYAEVPPLQIYKDPVVITSETDGTVKGV